MKLKINGFGIQLTEPDLNGDGVVDEFESFERNVDGGISNIIQPSEISESMKEINEDKVDANTKMSSIDMKSRLSVFELPSIVAIDSLVALRVFPESTLKITRSKKRNAVSIKGMGRTEQVTIATGIQEQRMPNNDLSLFDKLKGEK